MTVAARLAKEKEEALKREEAAKSSPSLGRAVLKRNSVSAVKAAPPVDAASRSEAEPARRLSINIEEVSSNESPEGALSVRSAIIQEADRIDHALLELFPGSPLARRAVKRTPRPRRSGKQKSWGRRSPQVAQELTRRSRLR